MTAQDLTRLNRDVIGEIREVHPLLTPKLTNVTIYHAVSALSQWQNTARSAIEIKLFGYRDDSAFFGWSSAQVCRKDPLLFQGKCGGLSRGFEVS